MGPQRASHQPVATVRGKHVSFGEGFRVWIMAEPPSRIRSRLVNPELVTTVESHARATRVDKTRNFMSQTACDNMLGPECVDAMVVIPTPPDASDTGRVEYHIGTLASSANRFLITQIATNRLNAIGV